MPSPRVALDLEAWGDFQPKERNNDYEYNLLLYKFRSFYNEVKDYHKLHSNCSVTAASNQDKPAGESQSATNENSTNSRNNGDQSSVGLPTNGQYVINLKKKLFQNQDPGVSSPRDQLIRQQSAHQFNQTPLSSSYRNQQQQQSHHNSNNAGPPKSQHYSSSHNLVSVGSNSTINSNKVGLSISNPTRPEIKQRGLVSSSSSNARYQLSKSSERLDSINNNHLPIASSLEERDLNSLQSSRFNAPVERNSKYLQNDDNIYDAVSPDDVNENDDLVQRVQVNNSNPNRSGVAQTRDRSEPKSSFIMSPSEIGANIDRHVVGSSVQQVKNDSNEQERSNNSFGSSVILDNSNNTSSSLSLNPSFHQQEYGNYVNIDFFLKRSQSPSFDGLDEEDSSDEVSDEEGQEAEISHSFSSDKICDDALRNLSPKELARKLSTHENNHHHHHHHHMLSSSTSITPASSGDFLDDVVRSPSSTIHQQQLSSSASSSSKQNVDSFLNNSNNSGKFSSFLSPTTFRDIEKHQTKSSHGPRENTTTTTSNSTPIPGGVKLSPQYAKTLEMIQENRLSSPKQSTLSRDSDSDGNALAEAHGTMRSFLSDLNLAPVDDVFEDKAQRRIVKESFAVELYKTRKLRHLFLFNDVIVCAKYQASSKQKFTFDVKWYLNLNGVTVSDSTDMSGTEKTNREAVDNEILAIRTNLMIIRSRMQQIKRSKDKKPSKIIKKLKKKRTELEADLVLLIPHLPLVIKHVNGKKYTFFLSSNFDRNQWIESIKFLQSQLPASKSSSSSTPSSSELQAWIQTCRKNLNPSLGTFLLRSNCDDDLLYGDLYITTRAIRSLPKSGHYYFCFEVDSYGHFSQKASSVVLKLAGLDNDLNDEYIFPLDGAHTLRILLYEDLGQNSKPSVVGKAHVELSRSWFLDKPVEKCIEFNSNCSLVTQLSFSNSELLSMRVPHAKLCPSFGLDITQVCKKEKTNIPLLIQLCVNEVERRGMREVGIYRMSGTSTDIQRLKKAFDTNPYVAELLLRDIDINSVTGFLKQYLREMPEGLFINKLYPKFVSAFNIPQSEPLERAQRMLELFHKIPIANQQTIIYLVEHLVKVNQYENYNKMSLTNLATVLGPNILRPPSDSSNATSSDPFTAVVIGSMSQAGILYFFLNRKASNLPLLELDTSELSAKS